MDLSEMVINFANDISDVTWELLFALAMLLGVLTAGFALLKYNRETAIAGNYGSHEASPGKLILRLMIAAMLLNIAAMINATSNTLSLGAFEYTAISYAEEGDFGRFADTINAVLTLVQVAGGIFFLIGLRGLYRSTSDAHSSGTDDTAMRGIVQMLFGCILAQIDIFLDLLRDSLGLYW